MVVYRKDHANPFKRGIFPGHEARLEHQAAAHVKKYQYDDQRLVARKKQRYNFEKGLADSKDRVFIVIDAQYFKFDAENERYPTVQREYLGPGNDGGSERIPEEGINRARLMQCSSLAKEFFTFNPSETELHLPVTLPRKAQFGITENNIALRGYSQMGQMAFVLPYPFEEYIIPWLQNSSNFPNSQRPRDMEVPTLLSDKIHLYNAMFQLGMPRFLQKPVIEELCKQIHCTKLSECELETLECTIGWLNFGTVPVLDPVLSSLAGMYAHRSDADKSGATRGEEQGEFLDSTRDEDEDEVPKISNEPKAPADPEVPPYVDNRKHYFEYDSENSYRKNPIFKDDTVIVPPYLEVLGHSIRHWSGVRANGSSHAAHVGYPLHIGTMTYYKRYDGKRAKKSAEPSHPGGSDKPDDGEAPVGTEIPNDQSTAREPDKTHEPEEPAEHDTEEDNDMDESDPDEDFFERWPYSFDIQHLEPVARYDVLKPTIHLRNWPGHDESCDCELCNRLDIESPS